MRVLLCTCAFLFAAVALAQSPLAAKYVPSEIETLKLQVAQKDAQLASNAFRDAQQQLNAAMAAIAAESDAVKKAHNWPEAVKFDPNTLTFSDPLPAPAKEKK